MTDLLLKGLQQAADFIFIVSGHGVCESRAVGMQNLQSVVAGVSDVINAHHGFDISHTAAWNHGDVDVGAFRQAFQYSFRFVGNDGHVRMRGNGSQSAVVVEE